MIAREIITRAFYEVVSSKYAIQDVDLADGLRYLNRMMAKLDLEGASLGYTTLNSVDDVITVPDSVILAMVKSLAATLWGQYNSSPINPLIKIQAEKSKDTMLTQGFELLSATQYPDTLPVGSGNYQRLTSGFYTNSTTQDAFIEAENDQ